MDKRVTLAVAGSGKTSMLVANLDLARRFLIVTFTDGNIENIRQKIIQKFGNVPKNIRVSTYFSFLYGFCYRPFLALDKRTKGVIFKIPPRLPAFNLGQERRYMTAGRWLYSNRLAAFVERSGLLPAVRQRLEKYYDALFVDEVQDFAGHDFNFLLELAKADVEIGFVGDFYQHTYDTSRDGQLNKTLHDDYAKYQNRFREAGIRVDTDSLKASRRCTTTVCQFIRDQVGISIHAHDERQSTVQFEDDPLAVLDLYRDPSIVKLFYQEHYKYDCFSENWGASKGMDHYDDVCVVLSAPNVKAFRAGTLNKLTASTRNKLYVACSRARGRLIFIPEALLKQFKQK
ncbi:AAA family ATPase [Xanthomonas sp. SHU 166]|uniref:AAA family ATPase n=1 Tax=Xanthomonas sp. SHU 166 TaxID=1591170 RepID=UPI0005BB6601|nr:AAA family ATPase [Xanthomonas sp. SHU 166]